MVMWFYDYKKSGFGTHFEFHKHAVLKDTWNVRITLKEGGFWFKSLDSVEYERMMARCKSHGVSHEVADGTKETHYR